MPQHWGVKGDACPRHVLLLALTCSPALVALLAWSVLPVDSWWTVALLASVGLAVPAAALLQIRWGRLNQLVQQARRREADQQALLRSVLDLTADGIFVCDELGNIRSLNHSAVRLFGSPGEEILGQPLS